MAKSAQSKKLALVAVVVLVAIVGVTYQSGLLQSSNGDIQKPSVSVEDRGDWGDVSEDRIEIIHTLNVENPNPVSIQIGSATTLKLQVHLNGIRVGSIEKSGLNLKQGENSVPVTSELQQNQIAEFWAKFINQNETIHARIPVTLEINQGPGFSVSTPPIRVSVLTDSQPVSDALNSAGNDLEGTYTKNVDPNDISERYLKGISGPVSSREVTVEYTIERADFEWGTVTPDQTKLKLHLRIRNSGDTRLPAVPDGLAVDVLLNDIEVFHARTEAISLQNIDGDSIIRPGQTKSYTLVATANNQQVERWFTTYAAQREHSAVRTELELYFGLGDAAISIPESGAVVYTCKFQTGIFVDNQQNSTTCGSGGTATVGPSQINVSELRSTSANKPTDEPKADQERNDDSPPTARIRASPTTGEAPLEVSFDARGSTDPENDITAVIWRFDDRSSPARGKEVTHTFRTAGEYEVELVVVDSQGNRDRATVTITVESRI